MCVEPCSIAASSIGDTVRTAFPADLTQGGAMRTVLSVIRGIGGIVILVAGFSAPAAAQDAYLGEIRWVAFNFAPLGWAECNGQIMAISQNTALFSLLGTTYGGNGITTFALPDLRGRVMVHTGMGPGLSNRDMGEVGGAEATTLQVSQMPAHDHGLSAHAHNVPALSVSLLASSAAATSVSASGNVLATASVAGNGNPKVTSIYAAGPADVSLGTGGSTAPAATDSASAQTSSTGGGQPHAIMQPFLGLKCIIAVEGIFPPRS
jgi:microcystin-dependent protein